MLLNGGTFEILWMCEENLLDEYVVRKVEEELIRYYKENTTYDVVNGRDTTYVSRGKSKGSKNKKPKKTRYAKIKVSLDDYDKVIAFLQDNNIDFK